MVCVVSPNYLSKRGRPATPDTLSEHKALRYTLAKWGVLWRFMDENGRIHQGRPQTSLSANNDEHIMQACAAGLGIALLPVFIDHEGIRDGSIEVILADYQLDSVGMYLVYPPGRYLSRRVRVLSEHMVEQFQPKAPWADCPMGARYDKKNA